MYITDNSKKPKGDFSDCRELLGRIADYPLEYLEKEGIFVFPEHVKDSDDLTKEQVVIKSVDNDYVTSNVMGFLGLNGEKITIKSRFSSEKESKDFFLQYLIQKVFDFPNFIDLSVQSNFMENIFMYLVFLFPYYLKKAMRKGLFKTYVRNLYNESNVKGTIDISRHIKLNTPFLGKIAYSKKEYSYDNYVTELIRHTVEYIHSKSYGKQILYKVRDEVNKIVSVTRQYSFYDRQKILSKNVQNPVKHAYYKEYQDLQKLCLEILKDQKQQISVGCCSLYGILFDGSWLWEEYVNTLIGDEFGGAFYHPRNKGNSDGSNSGAQRLFAYTPSNETEKDGLAGLIYPDFIGTNPKQRIIADAKYKPESNIKNKDYLQILAYMLRFDSKKAFYIYPFQKSTNNQHGSVELALNKGLTYEKNVEPRDDVKVIKQGIEVPCVECNCDYSTFCKLMENYEDSFKSKFYS